MIKLNNVRRSAGLAVSLLAAALVAGCAPKPEAHTSFATPDEAVSALVAALEKGDAATLGRLLGPGADDVISSGDAVADKSDRDSFVASYREKHELVADGDSRRVLQVGANDWPVPVPVVQKDGRWYLAGADDVISSGDPVADKSDRDSFVASYREKHELVADGENKRVLQVGANDWPVPVPVVQKDGRWYLDGAEGADEIIYRRVGENELGAIAVARGYVEAQLEYASSARDGNPAGVYAQKLLSDPDRQNGLYWPTADGEAPSPAGPFVASAGAEGYRAGAEGQRVPYHGYYYRSLYGQGEAANGGAMAYFEDGLLVQGFALIAWPADYGASGVKTFIVNQDGVVWEKDLGEDTATAVETIQDFNPDDSWTPLYDGA